MLMVAFQVGDILRLTVVLTCLTEDSATTCHDDEQYFCCATVADHEGFGCHALVAPTPTTITSTVTTTETATTTATITMTKTAAPPPVTTQNCATNRTGVCCNPDGSNCVACKLTETSDEQVNDFFQLNPVPIVKVVNSISAAVGSLPMEVARAALNVLVNRADY